MSKAILIIDNVDETEMAELRANVQLNLYGEDRGEYKNCSLKPTPKRKEVRKVKYINDVVNIQTTYDYITNKIHGQVIYDVDRIFAVGYNACIDEILGGEENA